MPKIVDTSQVLLTHAAKLVGKHGSTNLTRRMVAQAAGVSDAQVSHHLGNVEEMRRLAKREAKRMKITEPSKTEQEVIGVRLRAHGPRKATAAKKSAAKKATAAKSRSTSRVSKASPAKKATAAKKAAGATPAKRAASPASAAKAPAKKASAAKKSTPRSPSGAAGTNSNSAPVEAVLDNKLAAEVRHHADVADGMPPVPTAARAPKAPPVPQPGAVS